MDQIEVSAKTVEDALKQALAKLGATENEVEFVVLDEGRKGLFGRGSRDAVIRVERRANGDSSRTEQAPAPDDHGERGRSGGGRQRGGRQSPRARKPLERPAPQLTAEDFAPRSSSSDSNGGRNRPEPAAEAPQPQREQTDSPRRGPSQRGPSSDSGPRRSSPPRDRPPHPVVEPDIEAEEVNHAAQLIDDILRILDLDAEITIREPMTDGDGRGSSLAVVDLEGEDLGMLIGRRGDTLQALQYVVNVVLAHRFPNRGTVTVDAEHYRHRREEHLVSLARRMAERVSRTGDSITLEPMNPAERRLVHMALAEDSEVETNSTGSGDARKVVISRPQ